LDRLSKLGFQAKVGPEIEFYFLDENWNPLFGGKECYSIAKIGQYSELVDQVQLGLEALGINIEALHTEYGPGQMEIILEYGDALQITDATILARHFVKEIARRNGIRASFMAQPWADQSGSGYHLHQSLWTASGKNAFAADKAVLDSYAAGLLATSSAFMALNAPTVNSYKRLTDLSFAPTKVGLAYDNRTVTTRLLGENSALHLEQRTGSADANAYLLTAASVGGGLYGLEHNLPAAELLSGNGYFNEELEDLPRNLTEAAAAFDASQLAPEYLGEGFVEIFSEYIHYDIAQHHNEVTDWERERYLENS
jgi:glutamine synthetase